MVNSRMRKGICPILLKNDEFRPCLNKQNSEWTIIAYLLVNLEESNVLYYHHLHHLPIDCIKIIMSCHQNASSDAITLRLTANCAVKPYTRCSATTHREVSDADELKMIYDVFHYPYAAEEYDNQCFLKEKLLNVQLTVLENSYMVIYSCGHTNESSVMENAWILGRSNNTGNENYLALIEGLAILNRYSIKTIDIEYRVPNISVCRCPVECGRTLNDCKKMYLPNNQYTLRKVLPIILFLLMMFIIIVWHIIKSLKTRRVSTVYIP